MLSVFIKAQVCLSLGDQTSVQKCALCDAHAWEAWILKWGSHIGVVDGECLKQRKCPLTSSSQPRGWNPTQCLWILPFSLKFIIVLSLKFYWKWFFSYDIFCSWFLSPNFCILLPSPHSYNSISSFFLSLFLKTNRQLEKKSKRKYTRSFASY